jgi:hypothetical protein
MKDFKQICENLYSMLEDLDERLGEITDDKNQPDISETKQQSGGTEKTISTLDDASFNDLEKIKQAITRIGSGRAIKKIPKSTLRNWIEC